MDSYDIVAEAVRKFWRENCPQPVIAFFYQKYDYDNKWEWREELIECESSSNYDMVIFQMDFCEGQEDVKDLTIASLDEVIDFYEKNKIRQGGKANVQKIGRWIPFDCDTWECSECKNLFTTLEGTPKDNLFNFCPNCGAKMESDNND